MSDKSGSQVIVRLPPDVFKRVEKLTAAYSKRSVLGVKIGKATVAREAILRGLPQLEAEFEAEEKPE